MEVRRGDLMLGALPGDYGKVRPVLVIQDEAFHAVPSVTVLPLTSDLMDFPSVRIDVAVTPQNGLRLPSQIMVDKAGTVRRDKIGRHVGSLDAATMKAAVGVKTLPRIGLNRCAICKRPATGCGRA